MTVTLKTLLEEQHQGRTLYAPVPGTRYEVAKGSVVVLKTPTLALQETFFEVAETLEQPTTTLREAVERNMNVAQHLTDGQWPGLDDIQPNVVNRIIADFMFASNVIERPGMITADAYDQLIDRTLSKLRGQENGLHEVLGTEN